MYVIMSNQRMEIIKLNLINELINSNKGMGLIKSSHDIQS